MDEIGITGFGAYIPRLRLQRPAVYQANAWFAPGLKGAAKGERAMSNWDEDAVTMAVEAARNAFGDHDRNGVDTVILASTTAPFADRQNAGIVKEALNLSDTVSTLDVGASQKAGTGALLIALRGAGSGETLCIAADKHRARPGSEAELTDGHAAAALRIGRGAVLARLLGVHSVSVDFVDHFRAQGEAFDYVWESRWIRDEGYVGIVGGALKAALARFGVTGAEIDHLIVPIPAKGVPETLAKLAGIRPDAIQDTLGATMGHAGTAHPLVLLTDVLSRAEPGRKVLVLGVGQGADVLLFETTEALASHSPKVGAAPWLARRKAEANYLKYLAFEGHLTMEAGIRAEFDQKQPLTALYRNRKTVLGLVGGRCTKTGVIQYPRSEIGVGGNDAPVGTQEDYPFADVPARILTYTADNLTYSPDPPGYYGMVEFEGGGRMVCEFTDVDPDQIEVGAPMRMMFRIKAVDERRGFVKYFWKAVPAVGES